jgi:aspartate racemase
MPRTKRTERTEAPTWQRTIGIVGGLGPFAHLELERQLLAATARRLDRPPRDQDFPEWIASSIPATPDRTNALLGDGPSPLPWLETSVRRLCCTDAGGADFAVIACNTAHAYLDELRHRTRVPLLDMIEETLRVSEEETGKGATIGLLATTGTIKAEVYQHALEANGHTLRLISLLDTEKGKAGEDLQERLVMEPIYGPKRGKERAGGGIKSGLLGEPDERQEAREHAAGPLREAVERLARAGAQACILGCTEIPLALGREPVAGTPLLDPLAIMAEASVAIAAGERDLPHDARLGPVENRCAA